MSKKKSVPVTLTLPTATVQQLQELVGNTGISVESLINAILTLHVVKEARRIERERLEEWL